MANPKTLTTEECTKLLLALHWKKEPPKTDKKCVRNYTIAVLMLDAGLRVGEVVQLRISDLWFNSIPVTSIIIRPDIAKNKTERIIPISERLSNALKIHAQANSTLDVLLHHKFVFHGANEFKPLTTRQVERIIRAAAMKALGRPVHPHVLRHTFASRLMRVTDMRTVQELLGHKSLSSTQIYTHPNSEDLQKAIDSLPSGGKHIHIDESGLPASLYRPNRPDTSGTDRDMG